MSALSIREVTAHDIPSLVGLSAELGYHDSEEEIRRRYEIVSASPVHKIFVAERDRIIIGLMSFHALDTLYGAGKLGRITALVVTESERGKGVGKLLVKRAEELAHDSGCKRIELTSNNRRTDAHKFYESIGFEANSKRFIKSLS
jgi:GNAT superfamily N-acetyltransferase